ncbi:MAG: methyltransferase domain-containing protein [Chloroflexi bacterium]|nr:methyltransferase domain-containing protein [Chloroflexota bacterium]
MASFIVPENIEGYAARHTTPVPKLLQELTDETFRTMESPAMLSGQLEGTLLQYLISLSSAKRVLELGMFTGFSALMMAAALPPDGKLITCDVNPKAREFASRYFSSSPHGHKIEIRLGPALETMKTLQGPFDFVFIDADKPNYINYYERALDLLSPKGIIAVDNVLWSGRVLDPKDESSKAIAAFNDHIAKDKRVQVVMLTIRDGLSLIRRAPAASA